MSHDPEVYTISAVLTIDYLINAVRDGLVYDNEDWLADLLDDAEEALEVLAETASKYEDLCR